MAAKAKRYEDMTKAELIAEIDAVKAEFTIRLKEGGQVRERLREYREETRARLRDSEAKCERLKRKLKKQRREARQWRSRALGMCGNKDHWKRYAEQGDKMIRTLRKRADKWRDKYSYARVELRDAQRELRKERVERVREEAKRDEQEQG